MPAVIATRLIFLFATLVGVRILFGGWNTHNYHWRTGMTLLVIGAVGELLSAFLTISPAYRQAICTVWIMGAVILYLFGARAT